MPNSSPIRFLCKKAIKDSQLLWKPAGVALVGGGVLVLLLRFGAAAFAAAPPAGAVRSADLSAWVLETKKAPTRDEPLSRTAIRLARYARSSAPPSRSLANRN